MAYILSPEGVTFITTEESCALSAYDKDGHPTYGFGSTWRPDGSPVEMGDVITKDDAIELFKSQVKSITDTLWRIIPGRLTQYQVDALTSLLFNCGVGLVHSSHTLGQAIAANDREAIANAILLYDEATINGVRGPFLAARRKAEHDMFNGAKEVSTPSGVFQCAT